MLSHFKYNNNVLLTHFIPLVCLTPPQKKHKKKSDFQMFSRGIERDHWHEVS